MIRFKNEKFEDYFIDPVTAIITDKNGVVQKQKLKHGRPHFKGLSIHQIQMHTNSVWGYIEGMIVHHIDRNKLNNSLKNLQYLTNSEHSRLHRNEDENIGFGDQHGEKNYMYGVKYKWINDGVKCKFLFEGQELPKRMDIWAIVI